MNWWDFGWWTAARVAAGAETLGAVGTIAAVVTALALARRDSIRGRREDDQRLLAQARLVRVMGPRWGPAAPDGTVSLSCEVVNHGDRPILDAEFSVWDPDQTGADRPAYVGAVSWVEPSNGQTINAQVRFETDQAVVWRVTWRDASGRQWYADGASNCEARPWKPGKRNDPRR